MDIIVGLAAIFSLSTLRNENDRRNKDENQYNEKPSSTKDSVKM
jgi:hypothetical protein